MDSGGSGEEKKIAVEEKNSGRVAGGDEIEDLATEDVGSAQLTAARIIGEECEGVWSLDGAADKPEAGEVGGESGAGGRWKGSVFMDDEGVANGREVVERLEGPDKVTPVGGGGEGVDFAGTLSGNRDGGSGKNTVAPAEPAPSSAGTLAADCVEFAPRTEDRAPERLDEGTEHGEDERLDEISERAFRGAEVETTGYQEEARDESRDQDNLRERAIAVEQAPAEPFDDAGHRIDAIEGPPAFGKEAAGIDDGSGEHP